MIQSIKRDKLDFIKIKNCCSGKDTVKKMEKQNTGWEKISAGYTFVTRDLCSAK